MLADDRKLYTEISSIVTIFSFASPLVHSKYLNVELLSLLLYNILVKRYLGRPRPAGAHDRPARLRVLFVDRYSLDQRLARLRPAEWTFFLAVLCVYGSIIPRMGILWCADSPWEDRGGRFHHSAAAMMEDGFFTDSEFVSSVM